MKPPLAGGLALLLLASCDRNPAPNENNPVTIKMPHVLDDCVNDGLMWRASIDPSAFTGSFVECLIPLDENCWDDEREHYIPDHYKQLYDLYIEREPDFRDQIASVLLLWANEQDLLPQNENPSSATGVLSHFRLSQIYFPEDLKEGEMKAELLFYPGEAWSPQMEIQIDLNTGVIRYNSTEGPGR